MSINPLENKKDYWVYADSSNPKGTVFSGKWMMFVHKENLAEKWKLVADATKDDRLGFSSKCATGKFNSLARDPDVKVICIYTKNSKDKTDVARVLFEIRKLGFSERLFYKTDQSTKQGQYGKKSWLYESGEFQGD